MKHFLHIVFFALLMASPVLAQSPETSGDSSKGASGLPLPRFASLHVDEVNLRTGPGTRYPIEWVYRKDGLPVEITAEFDIWRRVRDWEGSEGWVQKSALTGKRTAIVTGGTHNLRSEASPQASIVAYVEQGAIGHIRSCNDAWCEIQFNDIKGYLPKSDFWGAYDNESFEE